MVVPALISKGADDKSLMNVHALITSELDFMGNVEGVVELDDPPSGSCMTSTSCLRGVAQKGAGSQVIVATLAKSGDGYSLDAVLYDAEGNSIVRREGFALPGEPSALADEMASVVQTIVNGQTVAAAEAAATPTVADFDDDDEDDFEFDATPIAVGAGVAAGVAAGAALSDLPEAAEPPPLAPPPTRTAPPPPPPPPAAPPPPPPAPAPVFDPSMISFGTSSGEITAEAINFGSAADQMQAEAAAPTYAPSAPAGSDPSYYQDAYAEADALADLDGDVGGKLSTAKLDKNKGGLGSSDPGKLGVGFRVGYSKYYGFNFVTAGGEVAIPVSAIHFVAGMEVYAVNRQIPTELQPVYQKVSEWNTIFPLNFGVVYKIETGVLTPYFGGDLIMVNYYESSWAVGARARAGLDIMATPQFGFNVNLSAGAWSGSNWDAVQEGTRNSGVLPQVSAGTVVAF